METLFRMRYLGGQATHLDLALALEQVAAELRERAEPVDDVVKKDAGTVREHMEVVAVWGVTLEEPKE